MNTNVIERLNSIKMNINTKLDEYNDTFGQKKMHKTNTCPKFLQKIRSLDPDDTKAINDLHNELIKNYTSHKQLCDLIKYEFENYENTDNIYIENVDKLLIFAKKEIMRYQGKICRLRYEDDDWIINSKKYNRPENVNILCNTMRYKYFNDEQQYFIEDMALHLQKFTKTIKIKFEWYLDKYNDMYWIILIFIKD